MKITKRQLRRIIRETVNWKPLTRAHAKALGQAQPETDTIEYGGEEWTRGDFLDAISDFSKEMSGTREDLSRLESLTTQELADYYEAMFEREEAKRMQDELAANEMAEGITTRKLRKIIRQSIIREQMGTFNSRRSIPRSVQADYDMANKEDTFPKAKPPKGPSPDLKASYEMINKEITKALQDMPGYKSLLYGEGAYVDAKRKEVVEMLKPIITKIGAKAKDGYSDETFIKHPSGVMVTVFGSGTGTEIDFGPTPGS